MVKPKKRNTQNKKKGKKARSSRRRFGKHKQPSFELEEGEIPEDDFHTFAENNQPSPTILALTRQDSDSYDSDDYTDQFLLDAERDEDIRPKRKNNNKLIHLSKKLGIPLILLIAFIIQMTNMTSKNHQQVLTDLTRKNKEDALSEIKNVDPDKKIPIGAKNAAAFRAILADSAVETMPFDFSGKLVGHEYDNDAVKGHYRKAHELEKKAKKAMDEAVRKEKLWKEYKQRPLGLNNRGKYYKGRSARNSKKKKKKPQKKRNTQNKKK
tara:strand:- start:89 stop:889 length:801 start_codon:yes stop_codon:yes gene_type:complete